MPGKHAKLSPSSADRWVHCPGSVTLSEQVLPQGSTPYADEGTLAHAVAELKLRSASGQLGTRLSTAVKRLTKDNEYWCGEMDEATDYYANAVMEELGAAGKDAELMVEQRFSLSDWVPDSFGTSDAVVIGGNAIQVIDLKYGKGVKVNAVGNPQLRLYGLGAAGLFGDIYDFDTVRMTIIQPRLDHVSTEELPLEELLRWAREEVTPAAEEAMEGSERTACGDWCRFCPAKALCRTRAEYCLEVAKEEFKDPPLLTEDEIGEVLRRAEMITKWASDVTEYTLQQALAGQHYDGWKVVEGRSVRKYSDEAKVVEALRGAGYDEAMLYERRLYGITAMEKMVGKKSFEKILDGLIIKPPGKPVLVPESDKREAINTAAQAAADFEEDLPFC